MIKNPRLSINTLKKRTVISKCSILMIHATLYSLFSSSYSIYTPFLTPLLSDLNKYVGLIVDLGGKDLAFACRNGLIAVDDLQCQMDEKLTSATRCQASPFAGDFHG